MDKKPDAEWILESIGAFYAHRESLQVREEDEAWEIIQAHPCYAGKATVVYGHDGSYIVKDRHGRWQLKGVGRWTPTER